jgi:hypothetical protein
MGDWGLISYDQYDFEELDLGDVEVCLGKMGVFRNIMVSLLSLLLKTWKSQYICGINVFVLYIVQFFVLV